MVAINFSSALATFLLATPLLVAASPFPNIPRSLPAGTARLALDDASHKLIAYDASGKELGKVDPSSAAPRKRDAGSCVNLSSDDVQKLPGWKALDDEAKKNWGNGKHKVVTNDKDFVDSPAQVCVDNNSMTVQKAGNPQCTTSKQSTKGKLVGSDGSVTLGYTAGTTYTSGNTVTKESSLAVGTTVSAEFTLEGLADIGAEVSTTATFTNTLSDSKQVSNDATSSSEITMKAPEGKTCHLDFNSKACNVEGNGKVRFTATGWVWFEYDDRVQGHYKWALNIDAVVPNVDDRSSFAEFKSAVKSTATSDYHGVCT